MIKKSILTALVLVTAYHFLFPHLPRKYFQLSGQQRENYFRAQRYVHDLSPETNLILGSSMSLRLNEQALGSNYFKLAFGGGSILTGLEIIRLKGAHPSLVLIKMNQLGWDADLELVHDLSNTVALLPSQLFAHFQGRRPPGQFRKRNPGGVGAPQLPLG